MSKEQEEAPEQREISRFLCHTSTATTNIKEKKKKTVFFRSQVLGWRKIPQSSLKRCAVQKSPCSFLTEILITKKSLIKQKNNKIHWKK